ncbi:MAG TPA: dimethyl sulfoxide reductase subunit A, partial [Syntrophomonadaceae bacterium]|nr:dimethyl sulfoxide reductase subunit A [Syntrophomonadaceae bacterium]
MSKDSKDSTFDPIKGPKVSRRTFIKGVGAVTIISSMGFGESPLNPQRVMAEGLVDDGVTYSHAVCTVNCTSRCHLKAHVKDGRIVTVT